VASLQLGLIDGYTIRPDAMGALRLGLKSRPTLVRDALTLRFPASLSHRQTIGGALSELRGRLGLEIAFAVQPRFKAYIEGKVSGVYRPGWDDLYQPLAGGGYESTNRYSYWGPQLVLGLSGKPLRHTAARLEVGTGYWDSRTDPNYDSTLPTHLVPGDTSNSFARASFHYLTKRSRAGLSLRLASQNYKAAFSRDRFTGKTHAGPGGPPANPLQRLIIFDGSALFRLRTKNKHQSITLRYTHQIQVDRFDGYYSYVAPTPELELKLRPMKKLSLSATLGLELRQYGSNSYAAGGSHPALDYGDRRQATLVSAKLASAYRIQKGLHGTLELRYAYRRTNFPDYQPRVYPAGRDYSVDWDYSTLWVFAGVKYGTSL